MFLNKVFFDDNGYLSAPSLYGTNVGEVSFSVVLVTISSLKLVTASPQTMPSHVTLERVSKVAKVFQ
jgi:hypothetical protein